MEDEWLDSFMEDRISDYDLYGGDPWEPDDLEEYNRNEALDYLNEGPDPEEWEDDEL